MRNAQEERLIAAIAAHRRTNPDGYQGLGLRIVEENAMVEALAVADALRPFDLPQETMCGKCGLRIEGADARLIFCPRENCPVVSNQDTERS